MNEVSHSPITRRNLLIVFGTSTLASRVDSKAKEIISLSSVDKLPEKYFEETEELLAKIRIDPDKEFVLALIKATDSRIFGVPISYDEIRRAKANGGKFRKGILEFTIKKGGNITDMTIQGERADGVYRYGILGIKDEEGITLLDADEDGNTYFGKIKSAKKEGKGSGDEESIGRPGLTERQIINGSYRRKPIHLGYKQDYPEKVITSKSLPDKESFRGRILRSIRWKPITDAVENRYGIPRGLILAMMAQEGYGDPTLPNLNNDGGLGLIHIQAVNAADFGLKTLPRYTRRMRDGRHATEITKIKKQHNNNLRDMISFDDRFHPILAVDVAGRFLMEKYKRAKKMNPGISESDLWKLALKGYSGRPHTGRGGYGGKVHAYQLGVTTPSFLRSISDEFPSYGVSIDGKGVSYKEYLEHFRKMCENYELEKYKKLGKFS